MTEMPVELPDPVPETNRLDPRVVPYWWLAGLLGTVVLGTMLGVGLWLFGDSLRGTWRPTLIAAAGVLLGLKLVWAVISPPLAFRRWRWALDDELMLVRYGIVFHGERATPTSRLQHVDLTRGPIERLFGLTTLIVHTAGTEESSFRLPGLADADARELRNRILAARGDDVV